MRPTPFLIAGLLLAGPALADPAPAQGRLETKTIEKPVIERPAAGSEAGAGGASHLGSFDSTMVGRPVHDRQGRVVGEVKAVDQGRLIVSLGADLGIGARDVGMTRAEVGQTGSGRDIRLVTHLSRDELAALPMAGRDLRREGPPPEGPAPARR